MILLIDNYDSFTYNLVQLLRELRAEVQVVRNDIESVDELLARRPSGIVISPGPGRPETAGICPDLYRAEPDIPVLGVCLGHQCLGQVCGAKIDRAERLMHGKTSLVSYRPDALLKHLPNPFQATRYHSLSVMEETVPRILVPIAWSEDDGEIMAMRHRTKPYWGVQFHPESVLTTEGSTLLQNFLKICAEHVPSSEGKPVDATASH